MRKKAPLRSVKEPVQVYLESADRAILERAAVASGLPRAEVMRRGLRRIAAEMLADESPALAFLARASDATSDASPDVAERHDAYLAEFEMASWREKSVPKNAKSRRT